MQNPVFDKNANEMTVKTWRVKRSLRITVFTLSILALSLFFEGWRQVKSNPTTWHLTILLFGTVTTAFLLWLQSFWIYMDEKSKGTLKKRIAHFEQLHDYLEKKRGL